MNNLYSSTPQIYTPSKKFYSPIPNEAIVIYNKGTLALQTKKYDKAVKFLKESIKISETVDAWLNLGTTYKFLDKDALSIAAFENATKKNIYSMETSGSIAGLAFNNLGLMMYLLGNDIKAEVYYHRALEVWKEETGKDDFYDCKWNLATCVLRQVMNGNHSRWAEGWDLYENRFLKSAAVSVHSVFGSIADRVWCGQRDCRVLLAQEQGIGDTIMFSRFIPQLEADFNIKCSLQVSPSLGTVLGVDCPTSIDTRDYDYMLPLGSICRWINYVDSAAYIKCSEHMDLQKMITSRGKPASELNIGLVWSGSSSHTNDRHRSCPVGHFKFLTQYGNVWNLNPGASDIPSWVNRLLLPDWKATCAALNSLDFIVTVDTSLAHMSGAMGIPTYMLQPRKETDFRWSKQNLWYDSLTVIENPNDWSACIENLKKELLK